MSELVRDFRSLFDGRTDIIGNGDNPANPYRPSPEGQPPLSYYEAHLWGDISIGVYPQMGDNTVKWGCVDFDEGYEQSWPDAANVQTVLKEFGITGWCEKTKTKGWHVWVFMQTWTEAKLVREGLLAACQLVSAPTKEINPKQSELTDDKPYGNFVRLPYPGRDKSGEGRQRIWDSDESYFDTAYPWLIKARQELTRPTLLVPLANLYVPPTPKFVPAPYDYKPAEAWPPLIKHVLAQPPNIPAQGGRSSTMQRIAHLCRQEGLSYDDTILAVAAYDDVWRKYVGRPDRDQRIREIVDRAF